MPQAKLVETVESLAGMVNLALQEPLAAAVVAAWVALIQLTMTLAATVVRLVLTLLRHPPAPSPIQVCWLVTAVRQDLTGLLVLLLGVMAAAAAAAEQAPMLVLQALQALLVQVARVVQVAQVEATEVLRLMVAAAAAVAAAVAAVSEGLLAVSVERGLRARVTQALAVMEELVAAVVVAAAVVAWPVIILGVAVVVVVATPRYVLPVALTALPTAAALLAALAALAALLVTVDEAVAAAGVVTLWNSCRD
ncbi:hypothetical protein HV198_12220 [Citrobacter freundii]|uniref:hypothetical protein n=1 Tax=Citrobacter freundii TaxID=546 RepID=UPI0015E4AB68|nr:hypothetical protein [Citrobacter freundii]QLO42872.1 hypothetical protein HV215_12220 [Citrobacter freundii]QLV41036.1 hypothetical protein HV198_12220 [Citrobacter freundii]